jgi:hypothetical protein
VKAVNKNKIPIHAMKVLRTLGLVAGIALLTAASCQKQNIAPGGVYSGDAFLLWVDSTLVNSKIALTYFLQWCGDNDAALQQNNKSVILAGESIRTNAPTWFTNAFSLRNAYLSTRSATDSNALQAAVSQLDAQSKSSNALTNSVHK